MQECAVFRNVFWKKAAKGRAMKVYSGGGKKRYGRVACGCVWSKA